MIGALSIPLLSSFSACKVYPCCLQYTSSKEKLYHFSTTPFQSYIVGTISPCLSRSLVEMSSVPTWHHRILEPVGRDMQVVQLVIIPSCQDQSRSIQPTTGCDLTGGSKAWAQGYSEDTVRIRLKDTQGFIRFQGFQWLGCAHPRCQTITISARHKGDGSDPMVTCAPCPHLPCQFPSPQQSESISCLRCLRISCALICSGKFSPKQAGNANSQKKCTLKLRVTTTSTRNGQCTVIALDSRKRWLIMGAAFGMINAQRSTTTDHQYHSWKEAPPD